MLKEFVEKIESLALKGKLITLDDGRVMSAYPLNPVKEPEVECLRCHTLTAIKDYIGSSDGNPNMMVHVEDWNTVRLTGQVFGREKQRDCFIESKAYDIKHQFNISMPLEQFIVYIQSSFVQDDTTAAILKILGNVVQGKEAEYADDGLTQRVTARAGVTRREVVDLPNPVTLRPFRTFMDIKQPASLFVLRLKAGRDGEQPSVSLTEADGGAWKNQAIASIKEFFAGSGLYVIG